MVDPTARNYRCAMWFSQQQTPKIHAIHDSEIVIQLINYLTCALFKQTENDPTTMVVCMLLFVMCVLCIMFYLHSYHLMVVPHLIVLPSLAHKSYTP